MGNYISDSSENVWGWSGDIPDVRDKKANIGKYHIKSKVDLRDLLGDNIYNQEGLNTSVVSAVCTLVGYIYSFDVSRLFVYYNQRLITKNNSHFGIRDCFKAINKYGVCSESLWPYQVNYCSTKPSSNCYKYTKFKDSINYRRLSGSLSELKMCLSKGTPFVFGFSVYSSFLDPTLWNPKIDEMPIPNPNKDKLVGGHAVIAVGYSDKRKCFIVRNSMGKDWGLDGYFFMPYRFVTSGQCIDFWTIISLKPERDYTIIPKDSPKSIANKKNIKEPETLNVMIPKSDELPNTCILRDT